MNHLHSILQKFEAELNPSELSASSIPCRVLGYGEISSVLEIDHDSSHAAKRMPLFHSETDANIYLENYSNYCQRLRAAGLNVPEDQTVLVKGHSGLTVLYILQKQLPADRFGHGLLHTADRDTILTLISRIIDEIEKVWSYNTAHADSLELAIDGQISNWVYLDSGELLFVDTSTPLMHENGKEVLDPELLLQSAPSFLRWLIRLFFLQDVMDRYYDRRLVYTDLVANLFKEQRADLVNDCIRLINQRVASLMEPLERKAIEAYYREDKLIWRLFLGLRRLDRFIKVKLLRGRYEFVLPGKIQR